MVHLRVERVNHEMAHVRRGHHRDDGYGLAHARALGVGQQSGRQRRDLPKHAGPSCVAGCVAKLLDDVRRKLEEQNRDKVRGARDGHERRPRERLQAPHQAQRRAHQHHHVRYRRRSGAVPCRLIRHPRRVAVGAPRVSSVSFSNRPPVQRVGDERVGRLAPSDRTVVRDGQSAKVRRPGYPRTVRRDGGDGNATRSPRARERPRQQRRGRGVLVVLVGGRRRGGQRRRVDARGVVVVVHVVLGVGSRAVGEDGEVP
mmetsp:Transcript_11031/g.47672  ORF Transcript_11031/g.47672 Transcript_11031/m.47672 type:complete len:257 (+) Transcript_11031:821-1591(+)